MADPFIKTFLNAYIWQSNNNPLSVILYNMGDFIALPVIFYLNAYLLSKIKIQHLYFFGAIGIGVSSFLIIFYTWFAPVAFLLYGFIYGIGHGLYWANRNLLSLQETESKTRNYFIGLNFSVDSITSIVIPLVLGWLIGMGIKLHIIGFQISYAISMGVAGLLLLSAGIVLLRDSSYKEKMLNFPLKKGTRRWARVRLLMVGMGMAEASTFFLPTVLILMRLGNETVLGVLTAIASLLCAGGMYLFGRLAGTHHRKGVFILSIVLGLVTSCVLAFYQTGMGVLLYVAFNTLTIGSAWLAGEPLMLDIVDTEHASGLSDKYAYVADRELFLNMGRICIYLVCIGLLSIYGVSRSFLFLPLISWIGLSIITLSVLIGI